MRSLLLLGCLLSAWVAHADEPLAASIAKLRSDVDGLAGDVDAARAAARDAQQSLERRRDDLRAQVDGARLEERALRARIEAKKQALEALRAGRTDDTTPLRETITALRTHLARGVPFRLEARTQELGDVERALDAGSPESAVERLLGFVKSELELQRTMSAVRTTIVIDGKPMLAEVAHVGLVLAYFRGPDGTIGGARREGETWTWRRLDDVDARLRVGALFDRLRRPTPDARALLVPNLLTTIGDVP
jgi:hypothetical protein